jgi:hypothetical protein
LLTRQAKLAASIEVLTKDFMQKNKASKGLWAKLKKFYKGKSLFGLTQKERSEQFL